MLKGVEKIEALLQFYCYCYFQILHTLWLAFSKFKTKFGRENVLTNHAKKHDNDWNLKKMWFQQYDATCCISRLTIDLLKEKFKNYIVSPRREGIWLFVQSRFFYRVLGHRSTVHIGGLSYL